MKRDGEAALRSLARQTEGPFFVRAYGVTATPERESEAKRELCGALRAAGIEVDAEAIVEVAEPSVGATSRPRFESEILDWIVRPAPQAPRESAADVRRRLEAISAELTGFLNSPASSIPAPPRPMRRPALVLVRRLGDLGGDAEGVAGAIEAILLRGAHLLMPDEGLDTRTREGRGQASLVLRLGGLKAVNARERSLEELDRRREGLEVYGPVPFGFERDGRKLRPVPLQLEAVARAKELSRRGLSFFETALALNREERTWKDGTPWSGRRVHLILRNPIYDRLRREGIA